MDSSENLEIIIVDNNSSDIATLRQAIKNTGVKCTLICNNHNSGYGQGNNVGIKAAHAPIVLVMNPDVELFEPVFKSAISQFDNNKNLALLGMEQYERDRKSRHSFFPVRMNFSNMLLYKLYKTFGLFNQNLFCVHGACFFIRKSVFEEIGYFDKNLFLYGEEIDISTRLRRKNYDIKLNRKMGYIHPQHLSRQENNGETINYTGLKSMLYLEKKFGWPRGRAISDSISTLRFEQFKQFIKTRHLDKHISRQIEAFRHYNED